MTELTSLIAALGSPTIKVRRDAAARLGRSGNPSAVMPLVLALGDAHPVVPGKWRRHSGGWTTTGPYRDSSRRWPIQIPASGQG